MSQNPEKQNNNHSKVALIKWGALLLFLVPIIWKVGMDSWRSNHDGGRSLFTSAELDSTCRHICERFTGCALEPVRGKKDLQGYSFEEIHMKIKNGCYSGCVKEKAWFRDCFADSYETCDSVKECLFKVR